MAEAKGASPLTLSFHGPAPNSIAPDACDPRVAAKNRHVPQSRSFRRNRNRAARPTTILGPGKSLHLAQVGAGQS